MAARIKKGDTVIVLAGKDKGKRGLVSQSEQEFLGQLLGNCGQRSS